MKTAHVCMRSTHPLETGNHDFDRHECVPSGPSPNNDCRQDIASQRTWNGAMCKAVATGRSCPLMRISCVTATVNGVRFTLTLCLMDHVRPSFLPTPTARRSESVQVPTLLNNPTLRVACRRKSPVTSKIEDNRPPCHRSICLSNCSVWLDATGYHWPAPTAPHHHEAVPQPTQLSSKWQMDADGLTIRPRLSPPAPFDVPRYLYLLPLVIFFFFSFFFLSPSSSLDYALLSSSCCRQCDKGNDGGESCFQLKSCADMLPSACASTADNPPNRLVLPHRC
jgi:hypothetical protein